MHDFTPFYNPIAPEVILAFLPLLIAVIIWSTVLKGFALWFAARGSQKWWFVFLLVLNTAGLLEIIYLIWFRPEEKPAEDAPVHKSPEAQ
ncbi:MAG: DUF5652 family protein [Minisyncoccia bacterium]